MQTSTICLNMIVKNEANIIWQTLDNIRSHITIDYMVICDTGSTDHTIEQLQQYIQHHEIPAEIHQHEWVNFEHNRNQALSLCEGKSDYILIFDADDRFCGQPRLPERLHHDIYHFTFKGDGRDFFYTRKILIKNKKIVRWVGVLHESLINIADHLSELEITGDYYIQTGHFGDRNQNPNKYLEDAHTLAQAYEHETRPALKARYAYYCATSYYSFGDMASAIQWFQCRIDLAPSTNNQLESYLACRHLGSIYKQQKQAEHAVFVWLKGTSFLPQQLECLYEVSLLYTEQGDTQIAYDFAMLAQQKRENEGATALERNIVRYGIDYQILTLGIALKKIQPAYQAWIRLMAQPSYSEAFNATLINSKKHFEHLLNA